jgi:hypothetical protein
LKCYGKRVKFGFSGGGSGLRRLRTFFENLLAAPGANSPAAKFAKGSKNSKKLSKDMDHSFLGKFLGFLNPSFKKGLSRRRPFSRSPITPNLQSIMEKNRPAVAVTAGHGS